MKIGYSASYLVYKGGTQYSLPPSADFTASPETSCSGAVQLMDKSSAHPTSWTWDFGDGGSSNLQNPVHTYAANGTYTVKLTCSNQFGNDDETKTSYVKVNMLAPPVGTGATGSSGQSLTLTATGSGTLYWYTTPTGGTSVGSGSSYTTPSLSVTTDYYVESQLPVGASQKVGPVDTTLGGGAYFNANFLQGMIFNALSDITIKTIKVYASSSGNRLIQVLDGVGGTVIKSATINIPAGMSRITLNFDIPKGTGYFIKVSGSLLNLYRNKKTTSLPYPYSNSLLSITTSSANPGPTTCYYFFYDWEVTKQPCPSSRTKVTASITTGGINELNSSAAVRMFPNPFNTSFTVNFSDATILRNAVMKIYDVCGKEVKNISLISKETNVDKGELQNGMYFYRLINNNEIIGNGKLIVQ
ncbi:MAG: PKD domain-containing protein [Bacteroidales bacterium]|nr:PKD domain-containing protein [Bacteroidales bacterium]